ncbi:hypothetical protein B7992_02020 [Fibrobacter sp. UWH1]|nr:hypothetical protein B7992_02020 [Fibrobacter sp. UWH1]
MVKIYNHNLTKSHKYLAEMGLLYLYGKDADNLKAYLPDELYGVATASDIADLWNRDHGTNFSGKDMCKHIKKCAQVSKYFHYFNGGLTDYRIEFGDEITEIMEGQKGKQIYQPTREEIEHWGFAETDLNTYIPEYEKLFNAVKQFKDPETALDIASYLLEFCMRGKNPFREIEFLRTEFGLELKDINEVERVLRPLQEFNNNCRMWTNLGHTPLSLPRPGSNANPFGLANGIPFQNSGPKVGRNDPCPCGSGLKFKKCCGKNMN